jgi:hypothetical protein
MLQQLLLLSSIFAECVQIPSNSICAPYQGQIDTVKLTEIYGQKITIKDWEIIVRDQTQGGQQQQKIWDKYYKCPTYKGELIQYYRSFVCMTDLFVYSASCNKRKSTPLCPEVCAMYGQSVQLLLSKCPSTDRFGPKVEELVNKRRESILQASTRCEAIRASNSFDQKQQCIVGIQSDQESCGFAGNPNVAKQFCERHEKSTCCTQLAPAQRDQDSMNYVQRVVMMLQATGSTKPDGPSPMRSTLLIVGGVCAGVVLLGIGLVIFVRRRPKTVSIASPFILKHESKVIEPTNGSGMGLKCIVKYDYQPNLSDEMELRVGDVILFEVVSDDGWGDARNLTSGEVGKACTRFMEPVLN